MNSCKYCQKPMVKRQQFCSLTCAAKGKAGTSRYVTDRSWLDCSTCLGRAGFGFKKVGSLLAVSYATVRKAWIELEFKPDLPKARNWQAETGQTHNAGYVPTQTERINSLFARREWEDWIMMEYRSENAAVKRPDAAWGGLSASWAYTQWLRCNPAARAKHNLRTRLRARIRAVINEPKRNASSVHFGCTIKEFERHIASQFKQGMRWENYGSLWEIDHIMPMSRFNLLDRKDRALVNHFTNLRPMLKSQNRKEGARRGVAIQSTLGI